MKMKLLKKSFMILATGLLIDLVIFTSVANAINTNPDTNKTLNPNYVKLYLTKNENEELTSTLLNGKVRTYSDYKKSTQEGVDGVVLYSDKVTKDDVEAGRINFTLRMWVSDNAIVDENFSNKTFAVKINIYAASLDR